MKDVPDTPTVPVPDTYGSTEMRRPRQPFKTQQNRYFPDLISAAEEQIPPGCVVDGEALIWTNDRLDFNSLPQRMTTSKAALPGFVRERRASFAAFDVLAVAGHDTRAVPLRDRRTLLEELAAGWSPPLNLSPVTTDPDEAATWFEEMPSVGVEGLVVNSLFNSLLNERVDAVQEGCAVQFRWVKGHHGNEANEAADRLAVLARRNREFGVTSEVGTRMFRDLRDQLVTPKTA